jgi:hypothetical protein
MYWRDAVIAGVLVLFVACGYLAGLTQGFSGCVAGASAILERKKQ